MTVDDARMQNRRFTDELDWATILLGTMNPRTGVMEGGLVASVAKLAEDMARLADQMAFRHVVDSWILRVIGGIVILRELGMPRMADILKLIHGGAG